MWAILRVAWVSTILILITLFLLPIHILAVLFGDQLSRRTPQIWHKTACWVLGIKICYKGVLSRKRPLMIVSNHVSWLDIITLGASAPVVYIAKSEVRDWPIFGFLAKLQYTIFIDRNRRNTTGHQVSIIADRLKGGDLVVLFPEGTTSDGNYMLPFKSALFGAVKTAKTNLPDHSLFIQPISIAYVSAHGVPLGRANRDLAAWPGDVELMPHLHKVIMEGSLGVEITFGEPIPFDEKMKRREIAELCAQVIRKNMNHSLR